MSSYCRTICQNINDCTCTMHIVSLHSSRLEHKVMLTHSIFFISGHSAEKRKTHFSNHWTRDRQSAILRQVWNSPECWYIRIRSSNMPEFEVCESSNILSCQWESCSGYLCHKGNRTKAVRALRSDCLPAFNRSASKRLTVGSSEENPSPAGKTVREMDYRLWQCKGTQIRPVIGTNEKWCLMKCHRHNLSRSCISFPEKCRRRRLVERWVWNAVDNRHPIVP